MIQAFLCYFLDPFTNKYSRLWSSMINFVDIFSTIKEDLSSCNLPRTESGNKDFTA